MKRSKMLGEIADIIHTYRRSSKAISSDLLAQMVLVKIEELGMLPPKIKGEYDNIPTVTPTGNHEYFWKRAWEQESHSKEECPINLYDPCPICYENEIKK